MSTEANEPAKILPPELAPIGSIVLWPGPLSTIPVGWKLCNGEYLLASHYPALLAVCQDYWGMFAGSGVSQTFQLPDLRGVFVRGVTEERSDDFRDEDLHIRISSKGDKFKNEVGSLQKDGFTSHDHGYTHYYANLPAGIHSGPIKPNPGHNETLQGRTTPAGSGHETKPKNVYVNYIIRAA